MNTIRLAVAADVPAIAAIVDAAYAHYVPILGRKPRPMNDDHAARTAHGENFVMVDGEAVLGVIALTEKPGALHILNIALSPPAQGRGLLRELLGFAENTARRQKLPLLTLYTNGRMTRNRSIYAHLGFAETSIEDGGGYQVVHMERPVV